MTKSIVPPSTPPSNPSRRSLLCAVSGTAAAALGAPAGAHDLKDSQIITDPHPAWWREAVELRDWLDAPEQEGIEDIARTQPFARMCDLHDLIALTPASTVAGAAAQLAYVVYLIEHSIPEQREFDAIASAKAVLERLAADAA